MQDDNDQRVREVRQVRDQLIALHECGKQAHQRFLDARAVNDWEAMQHAVREHTAINREALCLFRPLQERIRRH